MKNEQELLTVKTLVSRHQKKRKKGRSELLERYPVTPPDVLHDKERGKGAKKAKKKKQVDKYDPVKQILYIDSLIFNNSY